jgi:type IV secretory pathway TraG/TraD family ATPase VirD4
LYSHLGSRGIATWTILQSRAQGERVWGKTGFAALWSAATVKMIGSGIDDAGFAEDISRLIGDHDVPVRTTSHSPVTDPTPSRSAVNASYQRTVYEPYRKEPPSCSQPVPGPLS